MNDLIYRQAAIDGFYEMASDMDHLCTISDYVSFLESLPSAPERKQGHWIDVDDADNRISGKCSVCGWEAHLYEDDVVGMPYCPNCGTPLKGVEDEQKNDISGRCN